MMVNGAVRNGILAGMLVLMLGSVPARADLTTAMAEVRASDWDGARAAVRNDSAAVQAVVEWYRLRGRDGDFRDYLAFRETYGDWPGMPLLLRRGEATIPANADPEAVLRYFGDQLPQTGTGSLRLSAALEALGRGDVAGAEAIRAWRVLRLSADEESTMLARYGQVLADHHVARMDMLLWNGWLTEAARMRPRVPEGWRRLHDARAGLRRDADGVNSLIDRVPLELQEDPGLAYERAEWRFRNGHEERALELVLQRSGSVESLGKPEKWAKRRRSLGRELMRKGQAREAYLLVSQHHLTEGSDYADLEWLSGYLALRKLDTPGAALDHFQRFRLAVQSPISLGRAGYWEGRAFETLGDTASAQAAYEFGGEFQGTFYGQLAAEKAGLAMDPGLLGQTKYPVRRSSPLRQNSVYLAGVALDQAGELAVSGRFFAHLAESLNRGEIGELLSLTEELGEPYYQLRIAKRAAADGHTLNRSYFPMFAISVAGRPGVEPELALAIARRESEFNPVVVSPAGARGLMQVMPGTAKDIAAEVGLPYSLGRLTADPSYNARLGTAYLSKLKGRFGVNDALVAVGYNAGPARPPQWIKRYGDPRSSQVDAVDWVEHIPFTETRNYVMRVTESLLPYRAQLTGQPQPLTLSQDLKRR
ncbi:lytic transglycosylase domain-containing protein [Fluviibacterium sp. DFM31]|uniref:Lytic transglycosylase domain-containing protein n=2 Tax=Meridianimarinicoccus marinus TaxID=3231483 RepID=A0ABV3L711_9RHOB